MQKGILAIILCLLLVITGLLLVNMSSTRQSSEAKPGQGEEAPAAPTIVARSIFSWEDEVLAAEARADLLSVVQALGLTDWYQSFSDEALYDEQTQTLLQQLHSMGVNGYYLAGKAEWGLDAKARDMLRVVDKVAAYNKAHADGEQLRGIVFDVEPYLADAWDEDPQAVMQSYLQAVTTVYHAAAAQGLRMVLCIPYWYDSKHGEALEQLIAQGCDAVSVMNYNRKSEADSMQTEVELARKHKKEIECIFEFQPAGIHSLTENETYYSLGLDAARQSYEAMASALNYDKLSFSYHYYLPVLELYKQ